MTGMHIERLKDLAAVGKTELDTKRKGHKEQLERLAHPLLNAENIRVIGLS
jgi:hypothetical protein